MKLNFDRDNKCRSEMAFSDTQFIREISMKIFYENPHDPLFHN